jgi:hypothetical protein
MLYLIKDVVTELFTYTKTTTVKICQTEEEVLRFLKDPKNLKNFKGDIKIEKVVL